MWRKSTGLMILALIALSGVILLIVMSKSAVRDKRDSQAASANSTRLTLVPCRLDGLDEEVRCGTYEVYEDRNARKGRKIALRLAVLPALNPQPAPDPLFFLAGGPGQAATESAEFVAKVFAKVRRDRDIVLVDQRGTGGSNPLNCELPGNEQDQQGYLSEFLPVNAVQACLQRLESRANLAFYTTPLAMDDLDEVRAALGYENINLYGTSYGTRAALVYMRRYPGRVRSAILKGVLPTNFKMPLYYSRGAQQALNRLFDDCAADKACRAAFPQLRREFQAVLERLERQPATAEIRHPKTGNPVKLTLARDVFVETLRNMLYSPSSASQIPLLIHQAFENDFAPFVTQSIKINRALREISLGAFLCVTCSEDVPLIEQKEIVQEVQGNFLGDYRIEQQVQACKNWPRGWLPEGYSRPVRSNVPVLLISGLLDPATPPRWGEEAARYLPNSLHVVIRNGSHSYSGLSPCVDNLMAEFISKGSVKGLDTSCVERIERPPYALRADTSESKP